MNKQNPNAAVKVTAPKTSDLELFSAELAQRFPGRVIRRFVMPKGIMQCRELFVIEITSREELDAAIFTEAIATPAEKASAKLMAEAERREVVRLSIKGLGEDRAGRVVYRHTNEGALPLAEISDWPSKAWVALHRYYGETNGVPTAELEEGIEGAQIVGAFYTPANQESAEIGRSDASTGRSISG